MRAIIIQDTEDKIEFKDIESIVVCPKEDVFELKLYDGSEYELSYYEARTIINEMLSD